MTKPGYNLALISEFMGFLKFLDGRLKGNESTPSAIRLWQKKGSFQQILTLALNEHTQ